MPRPKLDTTKHSINLRRGDYECLIEYCQSRDHDASELIRRQVSVIVDAIRRTQAEVRAASTPAQIELDL